MYSSGIQNLDARSVLRVLHTVQVIPMALLSVALVIARGALGGWR